MKLLRMEFHGRKEEGLCWEEEEFWFWLKRGKLRFVEEEKEIS